MVYPSEPKALSYYVTAVITDATVRLPKLQVMFDVKIRANPQSHIQHCYCEMVHFQMENQG
jgi:hypothetical protein